MCNSGLETESVSQVRMVRQEQEEVLYCNCFGTVLSCLMCKH